MAWKRSKPPAPPLTHGELADAVTDPVPRLHEAVKEVRQQLGAVERTLTSAGNVGETAREMIGLGPKISELGEALDAWNRFLDARRG